MCSLLLQKKLIVFAIILGQNYVFTDFYKNGARNQIADRSVEL